MKDLRLYTYSLLLLLLFIFIPSGKTIKARSVAESSMELRVNLLKYLRHLRVMVLNFPCSPYPECAPNGQVNPQLVDTDFIKEYNEAKKAYQEGLIYFYEARYLNAYSRFLSMQDKIENVLEELSQTYLERTRYMLREAIEKKNPLDPSDRSIADIAVNYGRKSHKVELFTSDRESPQTNRSYDSKEVHWMKNKHKLEGNMRMGYTFFGLAEKARLKAFKVARDNRSNKKEDKERKQVSPRQRKNRINYYFASIQLCRRAKSNAGYIFALKYPYDSYALHNPFATSEKGRFEEVKIPTIENVRMTWFENPHLELLNLHPVFDLSLPPTFRRDLSDVRNQAYEEQVDLKIRLKHNKIKPKGFEELKTKAP